MTLRVFRRELHRFVPMRRGSVLWMRKPGTADARTPSNDTIERIYDAVMAQRFDEEDPYTVEVGGGDA